MMKQLLKLLMGWMICAQAIAAAMPAIQTKPLKVNRQLAQILVSMEPDTSNAHEIEKLIGPPSACVVINPPPLESWACQWKGDLASNRVINTLNVLFESGSLTKVVAVTPLGWYYIGAPGEKLKELRP